MGKVERTEMRSDYEYITIISWYYLVWDDPEEPEREPVYIPVDPEARTLGDGWDEVFDESIETLNARPEFSLEYEATGGLHSKSGCLVKDVQQVTKSCAECYRETGEVSKGYVDEVGDDICPRCGMVLNGSPIVTTEDYKFGKTRGDVAPNPGAKPGMDHIPNKVYRPGEVDDEAREAMGTDNDWRNY